jgi:hypothetical protein
MKCDASLCGAITFPENLCADGWLTVTDHNLDGKCVDLHYCSQACLVRDQTEVIS